jgi:hypothetical protein
VEKVDQRRHHPAIWIVATTCLVVIVHARGSATRPVEELPLVQRFLLGDNAPLLQYRAFRRLEASNDKFKKDAWLDVWTEVDASGFRYEIVGQGGSEYVRNRVLRPALEREQAIWNGRLTARSSLTTANYDFIDASTGPTGLLRVTVKPKRRDDLLVDGVMHLTPEDGDLVRVEGRLAKSPSFWAGRVEVVRLYARIEGVRVPVRTESVAQVKMAGASSFTMTYEYETINGQHVGLQSRNTDLASIPR